MSLGRPPRQSAGRRRQKAKRPQRRRATRRVDGDRRVRASEPKAGAMSGRSAEEGFAADGAELEAVPRLAAADVADPTVAAEAVGAPLGEAAVGALPAGAPRMSRLAGTMAADIAGMGVRFERRLRKGWVVFC
jgi:hypothetical protein